MNYVYMSNLFMVERHLTLHLDIKHGLMKYIFFSLFLSLSSQSTPLSPIKKINKVKFSYRQTLLHHKVAAVMVEHQHH